MENQQYTELDRQAISINKRLKVIEKQQELQTKHLHDISGAIKNVSTVSTFMLIAMILFLLIYAAKSGLF